MKIKMFSKKLQWYKIKTLERLIARNPIPSAKIFQQALDILQDTKIASSYKWPTQWPEQWFEMLLGVEDMDIRALCTKIPLSLFSPVAIGKILKIGLINTDVKIFTMLRGHVDAKHLCTSTWQAIADEEPFIQMLIVPYIKNMEHLDAHERKVIEQTIKGLDPMYWLYDHIDWYNRIAMAWSLPIPMHWWESLYQADLMNHRDWSRTFSWTQGSTTASWIEKIACTRSYSNRVVKNNRCKLLARDSQALVKGAFFGDAVYLEQALKRRDWREPTHNAFFVLRHYYPHMLTAINPIEPCLAVTIAVAVGEGPEEAFALYFASYLIEANEQNVDAIDIGNLLETELTFFPH